MQREYIDLESVPYEEECAQVGTPDYYVNARAECNRFISGLKKYFAAQISNVEIAFCTKSNPHDFGNYLSVRLYYWANDEAAEEVAFLIENNIPATWSDLENKTFQPLSAEIAE